MTGYNKKGFASQQEAEAAIKQALAAGSIEPFLIDLEGNRNELFLPEAALLYKAGEWVGRFDTREAAEETAYQLIREQQNRIASWLAEPKGFTLSFAKDCGQRVGSIINKPAATHGTEPGAAWHGFTTEDASTVYMCLRKSAAACGFFVSVIEPSKAKAAELAKSCGAVVI